MKTSNFKANKKDPLTRITNDGLKKVKPYRHKNNLMTDEPN